MIQGSASAATYDVFGYMVRCQEKTNASSERISRHVYTVSFIFVARRHLCGANVRALRLSYRLVRSIPCALLPSAPSTHTTHNHATRINTNLRRTQQPPPPKKTNIPVAIPTFYTALETGGNIPSMKNKTRHDHTRVLLFVHTCLRQGTCRPREEGFFPFWRISRTVTECLRILIHISNYFQTYGNYGKNRYPIIISLTIPLSKSAETCRP